ncbi:MASE1 domain-containing protein [Kluyvera cryocrescens]|uniref:MASE1 domain-containing protein n=1 Tax=Kluyvera cryocrescens TaxID=580 RepID=UPI003D7F3B1C
MKNDIQRSSLVPTSSSHAVQILCGLGIVTCLFTLFSFTLVHKPSDLSPVWFPTAIMMAAFYRFNVKLWPGIALAGILGIIAATCIYSPSAITLFYPLVNTLEALTGALLLRRWLPLDNPLRNLHDWTRMAIACALIPPLLGSVLIGTFAPGTNALQTFFVWMIAEATGALALVPLGILLNASFLKRMRNTQTLLNVILTTIITLVLSILSIFYMPWPFTFIMVLLMWSAVRQPRVEAFLITLVTIMAVLTLTAQHPMVQEMIESTLNIYKLANMPGLPFMLVLLPTGVMSITMYAIDSERRHITESETRFRNAMEYSAIGMAVVDTHGQWLQVNKSLSTFLGYSQQELQRMTFQQVTWHEDLEGDLAQLDRLISGEVDSYSLEKRYCTRGGEIVWALLAVSLVRHEDGTPLYFIKQIEDINDLKKAVKPTDS